MKKHLFLMAALGLGLAACTNDVLTPEDNANITSPDQENSTSHLKTVNLATFGGNQNRIIYGPGTRADEEEETTKPKTLELIASIENPSKAEGFNFTKEEGGRWLSATSVFYDESTETYYTTYHMQGNNYHTTLNNDITGAIQSFKIDNEGEVTLGTGFRAENPNIEDFDFNHIYFDNPDARVSNSGLPKRIITVGHIWNVPSSYTGEEPYAGERNNTRAIIAEFDPINGKLIYTPITTANKIYNDNGKSLGDEDAGDANCVVSLVNYPNYFVTTRKGIAVLNSDFTPALNVDGSKYFVPTPGSAKFIYNTKRTGSMIDILYLAEERNKDEELTYETSSQARIAQFQTTPGLTESGAHVLINPSNPETFFDSKDLNILNYEKQIELPEVIKPIDGKNAFCVIEDYEYYVPLGTNGLYYKFKGASTQKDYTGVIKFKATNGYLPVNFVYAEQPDMENGHDGFIYVACGARLVILHRRTLEVVAHWNIPTKDAAGNELNIAASANYIHVEKAPRNSSDNYDEPRERIITVAFGQDGVKIFKFIPEKKTVWEIMDENELPTEIKIAG